MKKQILILAVAATFVVAGCAGMSTTEQRVLRAAPSVPAVGP